MTIQSRALRHFDVIRRCGSIRQAARQLHISSSALNRQLLALESQVGAPLFERLTTGLRLTPAGEVFARHVIHVIQDEERMSIEMQALAGLQAGHVHLVTVEALTHAFLPELLKRMAARHPRISFTVSIGGSLRAAERVIDGEADVAIGFVHQRHVGLRQLAVAGFDLGVAVPLAHPLTRLKSLRFAQCLRFPLVLPAPELTLREAIAPLLAAQPEPPTVILETGSFELMKRMALQDQGLIFVNRFGIEDELSKRRLVHLPLKDVPPSLLGVYVRARRSLPPAVTALCQYAAQQIQAASKG
jgi:DNA-binding transcriptional LysR family regulator